VGCRFESCWDRHRFQSIAPLFPLRSGLHRQLRYFERARQGINDHRADDQTTLLIKDTVFSGNDGAGIVAASIAVGINAGEHAYRIAAAAGNNVAIRNFIFAGSSTPTLKRRRHADHRYRIEDQRRARQGNVVVAPPRPCKSRLLRVECRQSATTVPLLIPDLMSLYSSCKHA